MAFNNSTSSQTWRFGNQIKNQRIRALSICGDIADVLITPQQDLRDAVIIERLIFTVNTLNYFYVARCSIQCVPSNQQESSLRAPCNPLDCSLLVWSPKGRATKNKVLEHDFPH